MASLEATNCSKRLEDKAGESREVSWTRWQVPALSWRLQEPQQDFKLDCPTPICALEWWYQPSTRMTIGTLTGVRQNTEVLFSILDQGKRWWEPEPRWLAIGTETRRLPTVWPWERYRMWNRNGKAWWWIHWGEGWGTAVKSKPYISGLVQRAGGITGTVHKENKFTG